MGGNSTEIDQYEEYQVLFFLQDYLNCTLQKSERPDIIGNNIGIEVVMALPTKECIEESERVKLFRNHHNVVLGPCHEYNENKRKECLSLIVSRYKSKLDKLQSYKKFNINILWVYCKLFFDTTDYIDILREWFNYLNMNCHNIFHKVYLYDISEGIGYIIDLTGNCAIDKISINFTKYNKDLRQLSREKL